MIYGIKELDYFLKKKAATDDNSLYDESTDQITYTRNENGTILEVQVNNGFIMVPLFAVLTVIMIWCFYLRFVLSFINKNKITWMEVRDQYEDATSRNKSKYNLHLVAEETNKKKEYSSLFDKYWYIRREYQYIEGIQYEQLEQFDNYSKEDIEANPH